MSWLAQFQRPVLFAHRGASAHAPENTLAAFRLAVEHGADAVELDAKLCASGEIVVLHDQTVDRTCDGRGDVRNLSLADLRRMDAGGKFDARFAGERIPTLAEVLEEVGGRLYVNIELTNYASGGDGLAEKAAGLVQRMGLQERVLFSSFNPLNLGRVRRLLPHTPAALLALPSGFASAVALGMVGRWFSPQIIHPYFSAVDGPRVAREHARGRRVHAWTVNEPADLRRMFAAGVDGVFTDDPRLARSLLEGGA